MSREIKEQFIADMRRDLERAAGVLFVDYTGLKVSQANALRAKMREGQLSYRVVKNTLMARAVADTPYADVARCLSGTPTGVVMGFEDPVTPAKVTYAFAKDNEQFKVKGGIVDKRAIAPGETAALAELPSREELQGAVVALAMSPGRRVAAQLKTSSGRIVGAIAALVERLEA